MNFFFFFKQHDRVVLAVAVIRVLYRTREIEFWFIRLKTAIYFYLSFLHALRSVALDWSAV